MPRVLEQLGGVIAEDRVLLDTPDRAALSDGFSRLAAKIPGAKRGAGRIEVIVYYSGHSDEAGLLLGRERFSYAEMRQAIEGLDAQVRIAIVDSCSSGALVRLKGDRRVAPFLVDASTALRGHAFLTASSADEAAQESDRIQGSFFTYALVTGLRGAADASRDGKVTLSEAYQYAFAETLARTEVSRAGPQHPTYDIQLVGSGDLVMTDLRGTSAGVVLAEELEGRIYLRDASGQLVAALRKAKGVPLELGLEPGRYEVTLEESGEANSLSPPSTSIETTRRRCGGQAPDSVRCPALHRPRGTRKLSRRGLPRPSDHTAGWTAVTRIGKPPLGRSVEHSSGTTSAAAASWRSTRLRMVASTTGPSSRPK